MGILSWSSSARKPTYADALRYEIRNDAELSAQESSSVAEISQENQKLRKRLEESTQQLQKVTTDLTQHRNEAQKAQRELRAQAVSMREQSQQNELLAKTVYGGSKQLQECQAEKLRLQNQLYEKMKRVEELEQHLSCEGKRTQQWQARSDHFAAQSGELDRQLQEAKARIESSVQELREFQLKAMEQVCSGRTAEEDINVRDAIERLHGKIRYWSKTFCVPSMSSVIYSHGSQIRDLLGFLRNVSGFSTPQSLEHFRYPYLILTCWLCEYIRCQILDNPFVILSRCKQHGESSNCGQCLNDMYKLLLEGSFPDAQDFRIRLLRLAISKSTFINLEFNTSMLNDSLAGGFINSVADGFWNNAGMLLQSMSSECLEELRCIMKEAAIIRTHLATQRVAYVWIPDANLVGQSFAARSSFYKADRLNKLDDDEDERCDGKTIKIVLSPYVLAYGNSDGENYEEYRVIAKAVVWVDDRKEDDDAD
ncbi:hypothetical protein IWX90DRAFT_515063 [Phyllosticta citrichinensis]|uniref:Uncharacterized protein n=1 Tax=Phyllosticta citrichinensis TaxID=1130410 RepID=A0ABR1XM77_9PEZI